MPTFDNDAPFQLAYEPMLGAMSLVVSIGSTLNLRSGKIYKTTYSVVAGCVVRDDAEYLTADMPFSPYNLSSKFSSYRSKAWILKAKY